LLLNDNIVVDYVLRYDLYRHRDVSERLSNALKVEEHPDAFNRQPGIFCFTSSSAT
jgi:hypothetical protein